MKTRSLLVIALLVIFSVFSYANALNITFDYDTVYMQTNSNASVIAQVENVSDDKVCFDVYSYIDTDEIKMIPAIKDLCLNSNERTEFSIAFISDEDADYGTYTAELELVYDDTSLSREITLELEE